MNWFEKIEAYTANHRAFDIVFHISKESLQSQPLERLLNLANGYLIAYYPNLPVQNVILMHGSQVVRSHPFRAELVNNNFNNNKLNVKTMFTLSYLFGGTSNSYSNYVSNTNGILTTASPGYFDIDSTGNLVITPSYDSEFVKKMQSQRIRVVPFLSNHWDREVGVKGLQNRRKLADDIAKFVLTNNLDGVQVDIENVTEKERDQYTDLVRLLHQKLSPQKEVSVAVAGNPNGWTSGWHGSYDYPQLNKYSDYLMIMSYDESFYGGPPGPVASFPWVKRSIEYALSQGIPAEKIVLGLPFFGRYWKQGEEVGGQGITNVQINQLISSFNATPVYYDDLKSIEVVITIPEATNVTTLSPGTYTIWYEDIRGVQSKLDLVREFRLRGNGSWKLGDENPEIWKNKMLWRR